MTTIDMKEVTGSSLISADGYDAATMTLAVKFHNGQTYEYRGVDPTTAGEYFAAESKGKYLSRVIKPNVQGVLV